MPKRTDIKKILIIGSGPIVIGQACEFDYSGAQACKVLRQEGFEIVLVNSNPATIMTDPEMADRTYIEPITPEFVARIIRAERPDSLLPTLGGQTGLNTAVALAAAGVLDECGVRMLGADLESIRRAEERDRFKQIIQDIGLEVPRSGYAHSWQQAKRMIADIGFPAIIRPSYTLGGMGGNVAYNIEEYKRYIEWGLSLSPVNQVLVEESVVGWKEYELRLWRPEGQRRNRLLHRKPSTPWASTPATASPSPRPDSPTRNTRSCNAAIRIISRYRRRNRRRYIQFAGNPANGKLYVIEMNPRVSRSSASPARLPAFPSPRSPRCSPSATHSTKSPTT